MREGGPKIEGRPFEPAQHAGDVVRPVEVRPEAPHQGQPAAPQPIDAMHAPVPELRVTNVPESPGRAEGARGSSGVADLQIQALNQGLEQLTDRQKALRGTVDNPRAKDSERKKAQGELATTEKIKSGLARQLAELMTQNELTTSNDANEASPIPAPALLPAPPLVVEAESRVPSDNAPSPKRQSSVDALFAPERQRDMDNLEKETNLRVEVQDLETVHTAELAALSQLKPGTPEHVSLGMQVKTTAAELAQKYNELETHMRSLGAEAAAQSMDRKIRDVSARQDTLHERKVNETDKNVEDLGKKVDDLSKKVSSGESWLNWFYQLFGGGISPQQHEENSEALSAARADHIGALQKSHDVDAELADGSKQVERLEGSRDRLRSPDENTRETELKSYQAEQSKVSAEAKAKFEAKAARDARVKKFLSDLNSSDPKVRAAARARVSPEDLRKLVGVVQRTQGSGVAIPEK